MTTRAQATQRAESIRNHAAILAMAELADVEALTHEEAIDLEVTVRQAAVKVREAWAENNHHDRCRLCGIERWAHRTAEEFPDSTISHLFAEASSEYRDAITEVYPGHPYAITKEDS